MALLVQGASAWEQHLAGVNVYRLELQQVQGRDYLHVGTVGQGVFTAAVDDLERWAPNSDGLPDQGNLFSFAVSAGGRLIAGTSSGLFWQQNPGAPWQRLRVGLEQSRILSLHLEPAVQERQRLWIGGDDGLFRVDLLELDDGLEAAAYAEPITPPAPGLDFGVSWIVPMDGGCQRRRHLSDLHARRLPRGPRGLAVSSARSDGGSKIYEVPAEIAAKGAHRRGDLPQHVSALRG
jgi:hypothetical protein